MLFILLLQLFRYYDHDSIFLCKFSLVFVIEVTAIVALSWISALWGWVFVTFNVNIAICCVVLDSILD